MKDWFTLTLLGLIGSAAYWLYHRPKPIELIEVTWPYALFGALLALNLFVLMVPWGKVKEVAHDKEMERLRASVTRLEARIKDKDIRIADADKVAQGRLAELESRARSKMEQALALKNESKAQVADAQRRAKAAVKASEQHQQAAIKADQKRRSTSGAYGRLKEKTVGLQDS